MDKNNNNNNNEDATNGERENTNVKMSKEQNCRQT